MRKKTGKKTALLLAAVMAFQAGFSTWATQDGTAHLLAAQEDGGVAGATGQVDVSVTGTLPLKAQKDFTVQLTGAQGSFDGKISLAAGVLGTGSTCFEGVRPGTYELKLTAPGFAEFSQTIEVETQGCAVKLTTGFLGGVNYTQGAAHPGVLLLGDVDGNGVIDSADGTKLVDAIERAGQRTDAMDLNGDGNVDLVDLEYFSKSYGETRDIAASIETFVPASVIHVEKGATTQVTGEVSKVLSGDGAVSLKPFNGEISADNPVSLEFNFGDAGSAAPQTVQTDGIVIETAGDNPIRNAEVLVAYTDGNGNEGEKRIPVAAGVSFLLIDSEVRAEQESNGNIHIHLGSQIAVKRVTLTITGMQKDQSLATISKVEFVNGMEKRIQEPKMDIPQNLTAVAGSEEVRLSWDPCVNITGYEVLVKGDGEEQTIFTTVNSIDVGSLDNYTEYEFLVQSVNGTWRSGYCPSVFATPKPSRRPDKPDGVSAAGNYQSMSVSWKKMKDTVTYNLYYKESTAGSYQVIRGIETNGYMLQNLKDLTQYTVYVTGVNEFGESAPSLTASAKTTDLAAPVVPRYHLINMGAAGEKGAHIISTKKRTVCPMVDSPLDTDATSAWGTVDNNAASYYQTAGWDEGGFNAMSGEAGLTYEFDQAYKMDTIGMFAYAGYDFTYVHVRYWDEENVAHNVDGVSVETRRDAEDRPYRLIKLAYPVTAKKIQIGLGRYLADGGTIRIGEVYFYHYDTLMEEIMALYVDDLHTVLRPDVTKATIAALRARINEIDEVSGEYNPDREVLERELKTAEDILNDVSLNSPVTVHSGITMNDTGRGFSGLNAWQPLGVTAGAGDAVTVYVGHNSKKTGEAAALRLVATQYHSESGGVVAGAVNLKVGANVVVIPRSGSLADQESGGALYIEYTGKDANDRYAVRVSGGVAVPRLDLYQVTDPSERLLRVKTYVNELTAYVGAMEKNHEKFHKASENSLLNAHAYDAANCVLGASDILLDTMMFSLPASQILAGAGSGTVEEKAVRMLASLDAMGDMMYLFYQHKGLNAGATDVIDQVPKGHLNIRYQRMFAGAFMYAGGNHIGIEWGSAPGMITATPVVADSEGMYQSGRYFGWGIAHEIGHNINQGAYAVAEITNNYFAVLAQAKDNNASVRFSYDNVFQKVTSNTKGKASNVFTQLAMYWQLHLAYDKGFNFKTYADYSEQLNNLFFARVDTYARTPSKAPMAKENGVALTLSGDKDQILMRLSCAAAEKNLLAFFGRWGMVPDADTVAYAAQFEEETRAIYYANDDARVYAAHGAGSAMGQAGTFAAVSDATTASVDEKAANQVNFVLAAQGIPEADVLGFEITRCMVSGGQTEKQAVGFVTGNTFTDTITSINNRMVWYEVAVIDKYLNRSAAKVLAPMKIEHDGSLDKTFFTVTTSGLTVSGEQEEINGSTVGDVILDADQGEEGSAVAAKSKDLLIDHDKDTVYTASAGAGAEILLEFNKTISVTGFKLTLPAGAGAPAGSYVISLLCDGSFIEVAKGSFTGDTVQTIYFANGESKYVATYAATALKLQLVDAAGTVSIAELDVLGVTGDNVDFRATEEGKAAIGRLVAAYQYGTEKQDVITGGAIVFTGTYKGSPDYNVVKLYDQDGNLVVADCGDGTFTSHQIILADVPETGNIQDVSDGTWIYWIEPTETLDLAKLKQVRVELYRVNNALTNEGERLVSDSLFVPVPEELPEITLSGGGQQQP